MKTQSPFPICISQVFRVMSLSYRNSNISSNTARYFASSASRMEPSNIQMESRILLHVQKPVDRCWGSGYTMGRVCIRKQCFSCFGFETSFRSFLVHVVHFWSIPVQFLKFSPEHPSDGLIHTFSLGLTSGDMAMLGLLELFRLYVWGRCHLVHLLPRFNFLSDEIKSPSDICLYTAPFTNHFALRT